MCIRDRDISYSFGFHNSSIFFIIFPSNGQHQYSVCPSGSVSYTHLDGGGGDGGDGDDDDDEHENDDDDDDDYGAHSRALLCKFVRKLK